MLPRFKKKNAQEVADPHLKKEQFLEEHNRLSPETCRLTLLCFLVLELKKPLFFIAMTGQLISLEGHLLYGLLLYRWRKDR